MADGGSVNLIKYSPDVKRPCSICLLCGVCKVRVEAVKYCSVCQEYLCTTCTRHHGNLNDTRSHKLLDCGVSLKMHAAVTMLTKCRYHPDRDIEMYCGEHDMVYCMKCIIIEHRFVGIHFIRI